DSQIERMEANVESVENLRANLAEQGYNMDQTPCVIQYNKRDLPNAAPLDEMKSLLNPTGLPEFEACATDGKGVFETLKAVALSTFPPRAGAVWSEDCCGEPVVQKAPEFPAGVPRSEEGWVVVSGILDERGWVTEPVVLTSEPEGVFDAAALKAFDEWRYELP